MSFCQQPVISESDGSNYISVSFTPDYNKFNTKELSDEHIALFTRRLYDIAGLLRIRLICNDRNIELGSFAEYAKFVLSDKWENETKVATI